VRRGQQGIDQVNSRFHRHHHPRLEHARQPQVGMTLGPLPLVALIVAHDAADIVDLQPQQMTDAMREKHAGNAQFERSLPRQARQADLLHEVAQTAVCR